MARDLGRPRARGPPAARSLGPGYERWDGGGALGYLTLAAVVAAQLAARRSTLASSSACERSPQAHSALGACARRGRPRRDAHGDLSQASRLACRGAELTGTNPLAIAVPRPTAVDVSDVSMARHPRRRARRPRPSGGSRSVRRPTGSQGVRARGRVAARRRRPARRTDSAPCSSSRDPSRTRCRRCARSRQARGCRGTEVRCRSARSGSPARAGSRRGPSRCGRTRPISGRARPPAADAARASRWRPASASVQARL